MHVIGEVRRQKPSHITEGEIDLVVDLGIYVDIWVYIWVYGYVYMLGVLVAEQHTLAHV